MQIKHRVYNNVLYIMLNGELDEHSAKYTSKTLDDIMVSQSYRQVIFDLSEMGFMDSTGIGVLIGRYKKLKNKGVGIFITNPSYHAEKIFKLTGLYEIMPKIS